MRIGTRGLHPVRPATPPGRAAARQGEAATDIHLEAEDASTGTALAVLPRTPGRRRPVASAFPGSITVQLLAQKLPGKSERRLARYFPERVHNAYRQAAAVHIRTTSTHKSV